jgi:5'-deoxynucleotidase YfbR-like HD superfamily hydrolase
MSTVVTRSGARLDLSDPSPGSVFRGDIASGLSGACRFAAQTEVFYSVAQHAVMVAEMVDVFLNEGEWGDAPKGAALLAALHHDSHEAFMSDIPAPLKQLLPGYDAIAIRLDSAIHEAIGLSPRLKDEPLAGLIHRADMVARCVEAERIIPQAAELVLSNAGSVEDDDLALGRGLWTEPLHAGDARAQFIEWEDKYHDMLVEETISLPAGINPHDRLETLRVLTLPLSWFEQPA